ncbi:hypothetical protein HanRHA438_Chr11g0525021 [Helianthus annuus]|nr:hypothetical protein HanIR_Chr11g0551281 [Helianthus annuus]KAJ0872547.1 hypothetical protein HanRHA438_Chr11g0525021 [Helianthus annuus]
MGPYNQTNPNPNQNPTPNRNPYPEEDRDILKKKINEKIKKIEVRRFSKLKQSSTFLSWDFFKLSYFFSYQSNVFLSYLLF